MGIKAPGRLFHVKHVDVLKVMKRPEPEIIEKVIEVPVPVVDDKKVKELSEINDRLQRDLTTMRLELNRTKEDQSARLISLHHSKPKEIIREIEKPVIVESIKEIVVSRTPPWVWAAAAALSAASYLLGGA